MFDYSIVNCISQVLIAIPLDNEAARLARGRETVEYMLEPET